MNNYYIVVMNYISLKDVVLELEPRVKRKARVEQVPEQEIWKYLGIPLLVPQKQEIRTPIGPVELEIYDPQEYKRDLLRQYLEQIEHYKPHKKSNNHPTLQDSGATDRPGTRPGKKSKKRMILATLGALGLGAAIALSGCATPEEDHHKLTLTELEKKDNFNEINYTISSPLEQPEAAPDSVYLFVLQKDQPYKTLSIHKVRDMTNNIIPQASRVLIDDNEQMIERLEKYLEQKNITYRRIDIQYDQDLATIELSYKDFLENTDAILSILDLEDPEEKEYLELLAEKTEPKPVENLDAVGYQEFWDYVKKNARHQENKTLFVSFKEIIREEKEEIERLKQELASGKINESQFYDVLAKIEENKLKQLVDSGYPVRTIQLDEKGRVIQVLSTREENPYNMEHLEKYEEFKNTLLSDMEKLGYFERVRGSDDYRPTKKFLDAARNNPQKVFEDLVATIEKRMEYDDYKRDLSEKYIENPKNETLLKALMEYPDGIETYSLGKGVCHDYAVITREAWMVLQGYAPELGKIRVGYASTQDLPDGLNHAWNYVQVDDKVTYVDVTWDDSDNRPIEGTGIIPLIVPNDGNDISAMDPRHYFVRESKK